MSSETPEILPRLYSDDEAAEYFGMSKVTLWRERQRGRINFRRCAGRLIYTQRDLLDYLAKCSVGHDGVTRESR
jgi:hypothetical protein